MVRFSIQFGAAGSSLRDFFVDNQRFNVWQFVQQNALTAAKKIAIA
jgi:hypothetical protein